MLVSCRPYAFLLLPWLAACSGAESNKDPLFAAKFENEKRIGEANITKRQIHDAEFVVETVSRKMELLEISQIAQRKAASADARYTAQNVIAQTTALLTDLKALAQQKTLTLPTGLGESQAQQVGELTALNGAAFDQKYAELTAKVLDTDEDATDDMTDDAYDADIRALATRQLSTLKSLNQATDALHDKLNP
jgi:putative membrane protein